MTNEEFLRNVCPNHTDKSKWNKSELLHILELHKEQLLLTDVVVPKGTLCANLDSNNNCKNMCLTRCVDGNKFWK